MNIGQIARDTGLPVKTIRYYEEAGLIAPHRAANGYRDFSDADLDRLRLLAQARSLGFSLDSCRQLLELHDDKARASRDVRALAVGHLAEVQDKIARLRALEANLQTLIAECRGDGDPDCAILDHLSEPTRAPD